MAHTLGCELPVGARHCLRKRDCRAAVHRCVFYASAAVAGSPRQKRRVWSVPHQWNLLRPHGVMAAAQEDSAARGPALPYEPPRWTEEPDPTPKIPSPSQQHLCDNPVDIVTGRKFEFVEDFSHASLLGLRFQRSYSQDGSGIGLSASSGSPITTCAFPTGDGRSRQTTGATNWPASSRAISLRRSRSSRIAKLATS